jgi:hypothetical protein
VGFNTQKSAVSSGYKPRESEDDDKCRLFVRNMFCISSYLLVLLMLEPEGGLYAAPLVQEASSHVDVSHISGIPAKYIARLYQAARNIQMNVFGLW